MRDVIDTSAAVKDSLKYDAFGNITSETSASDRGLYAWTGRETDVESELQRNGVRWSTSGIAPLTR